MEVNHHIGIGCAASDGLCTAIKVHSLAAEDAKWTSGVCYFRMVENMVMLLKAMRKQHTQWDEDDTLRIKYMEEQITPLRHY